MIISAVQHNADLKLTSCSWFQLGEDEELEAADELGNGNEGGGDEGVVVESYNGVIMLEDEGEESEGEDHDDDDDDDEDDEDEDDEDEEDGSEIEGHDRGVLGDHHVHGHGNDNDYLFLQLDEARQGMLIDSFPLLVPFIFPYFLSCSLSSFPVPLFLFLFPYFPFEPLS